MHRLPRVARIWIEVINVTVGVPLEKLIQEIPEDLRDQVYDFARYLLHRRIREEDISWSQFSLREAGQQLEPEISYSETDLKERWQ